MIMGIAQRVARSRARKLEAGLKRIELHVAADRVPLLREIAEALAEPGDASAALAHRLYLTLREATPGTVEQYQGTFARYDHHGDGGGVAYVGANTYFHCNERHGRTLRSTVREAIETAIHRMIERRFKSAHFRLPVSVRRPQELRGNVDISWDGSHFEIEFEPVVDPAPDWHDVVRDVLAWEQTGDEAARDRVCRYCGFEVDPPAPTKPGAEHGHEIILEHPRPKPQIPGITIPGPPADEQPSARIVLGFAADGWAVQNNRARGVSGGMPESRDWQRVFNLLLADAQNWEAGMLKYALAGMEAHGGSDAAQLTLRRTFRKDGFRDELRHALAIEANRSA